MTSPSSQMAWIREYLYPYALRYKWPLLAGTLISCALAGLNYLNLQFIRILFDEKLYLDDFNHFLYLLSGIFGLIFLFTLMNWIQAALNTRMIVHINKDVIDNFYVRICNMPYLFFHSHSPGQLLTLLLNDITQVTPLITLVCIDAVKNVFVLLILFLYLVKIQWHILAVYACLGLTYLLVTNFFTSGIKKVLPVTQKTKETLHDKLIEYFHVIHLLKIFDVEGKERQKVNELNAQLAGQNKRIIMLENTKVFFLDFIMMSVVCALVLIGYSLISRGVITAGKFITILIASYLVNNYVKALFDLYSKLQQIRVYVDRLSGTLDDGEAKVKRVEEPGSTVRLAEPIRSIEFERVLFTYHRTAILQQVNCTFETDNIIGITGESGHGKTTILNLILKLVSPTEGDIRVNGVSLGRIDPSTYVQQIAYLPQISLLFSGTIAENIAFGEKEIDRDRVVRSAKMAGIHEFIESTPDGYQTRVKAGVPFVSEGEKKRIELARALYKDSSLIILDEPTAALDIKNKIAILKVLGAIRNKVVIIVSHDLNVLEQCTKIFFINAKKEVEVLPSVDSIYQHYTSGAQITLS